MDRMAVGFSLAYIIARKSLAFQTARMLHSVTLQVVANQNEAKKHQRTGTGGDGLRVGSRTHHRRSLPRGSGSPPSFEGLNHSHTLAAPGSQGLPAARSGWPDISIPPRGAPANRSRAGREADHRQVVRRIGGAVAGGHGGSRSAGSKTTPAPG